jgi:hypothetical protein
MEARNKKPTPLLGNRLFSDHASYHSHHQDSPTISEKQRDDNLVGAFFVPRGFVHNTRISKMFYAVGKTGLIKN